MIEATYVLLSFVMPETDFFRFKKYIASIMAKLFMLC